MFGWGSGIGFAALPHPNNWERCAFPASPQPKTSGTGKWKTRLTVSLSTCRVFIIIILFLHLNPLWVHLDLPGCQKFADRRRPQSNEPAGAVVAFGEVGGGTDKGCPPFQDFPPHTQHRCASSKRRSLGWFRCGNSSRTARMC